MSITPNPLIPTSEGTEPRVIVPFDVLDDVLALVQEDDKRLLLSPWISKRTLSLGLPRCRLVCREWAAAGQRRQFSHFVVSKGGEKTFKTLADFLCSSPNAAAQVISLTLKPWSPVVTEATLCAATLKSILSMLPFLQILNLYSIRLTSHPDPAPARSQDTTHPRPRIKRSFVSRLCSSLTVVNNRKGIPSQPPQPTPQNEPRSANALHMAQVSAAGFEPIALRTLTLRSFRMRDQYVQYLDSLAELFRSIDVLIMRDVCISDGRGPSMGGTRYAPNGMRPNHMSVKELWLQDASPGYILEFLHRTLVPEQLRKMRLVFDLKPDVQPLIQFLSQPSAPGRFLRSLHITIDMHLGHIWAPEPKVDNCCARLSQAIEAHMPNLHEVTIMHQTPYALRERVGQMCMGLMHALPASVAHISLHIGFPSVFSLDQLALHCRRLPNLRSMTLIFGCKFDSLVPEDQRRMERECRELQTNGILYYDISPSCEQFECSAFSK